jgi:AraC family transcriptional regulator, transcriptional activator FtrA
MSGSRRTRDSRPGPSRGKKGGKRAAPPRHRHHVVAVVVPGMTPLELAVAVDFFGIDQGDVGLPWYRFTVCTPHPGRVDFQGGLSLEVDVGLEALRRADTVVIPGWCARAALPAPELTEALRAAARRDARLVSFCTGAFVLAEAGLLDGRRATTHWNATEDFRRRFPDVELDPSVLYVEDGPMWTSAGSAASIDCALALIRHDFGAEIANRVAREMVVPPHREGGQAQFVDAPMARDAEAESLAATLDWAVAHLDEQLTVADLAERSHLGPRQLTRRFRETLGTTPHQWLLAQRILLARRLLETTDLSVDRVAEASGFSPAALRMHFQRSVKTSPLAYRRTFRRTAG